MGRDNSSDVSLPAVGKLGKFAGRQDEGEAGPSPKPKKPKAATSPFLAPPMAPPKPREVQPPRPHEPPSLVADPVHSPTVIKSRSIYEKQAAEAEAKTKAARAASRDAIKQQEANKAAAEARAIADVRAAVEAKKTAAEAEADAKVAAEAKRVERAEDHRAAAAAVGRCRMQSPPARGPAMRPTVRRPALRLLPRLLSLPGPLLLPPLWRRRGGGPATERPASGATRAASARGPSRRGGLPARVGDTSLRRSFVLSIPVARGANWFLAGGGRRMDEEEATAAAAERIAAAAEDGTSLPVRLATDVVRFLYGGTGRREPADGGVVSASLLNAKPAVGGIGVEPRGGGVLRVLFTVASDAVGDTVVRWRHELRRCVDSTAVFNVLSDREEAQHQALWPAFLAAKVAGKRAQFHRARLVVDGERVPAPAC
ncbi:hypothetical protein FOA52_010640 [Chlamydomonas sp. UWO 241]|nr:hypothetical protein FOA52_010640 [Chlamydomonas sp. UWO 241]